VSYEGDIRAGLPGTRRVRRGRAPWLSRASALATRAPRPELLVLVAVAATINLWALQVNGWANTYYSAAVRSMASSWHNFLFASLDPSGIMTVDKPPLSLWVQALSVRVFGYHQLAILIPQALMGVASVVLVYDLIRRRFGRVGGFVGGLALALTPITVAVSRHNNPDALLVLCSVAAIWCAVRALEGGRTRWLVLAGVCVGLGFETKMGVALTVVPGIALAWLWLVPAARGRWHALRQLLWAGGAMLVVGGAWPALVELTPASQRPWIAGTSDNSVWSLIFEYNGLGRVEGQSGGPAGGGGGMFGSLPGPFRLLNEALGGQAGWLLGFAVVAGVATLASSRLRRHDPRTGWLIAVGGAFAVTAVLFSVASGIFHPYYVSLLAPLTAALVGAGAAQLVGGRVNARIVGPLAIAAAVAVELVIRANYPGELEWMAPVLIPLGVLAAVALVVSTRRQVRLVAVLAVLGGLLLAPAVWALDTVGHAESGTFPAGGPASVANDGRPGGGFGGRALLGGGLRASREGPPAGLQLFGQGGREGGGQPAGGPPPSGALPPGAAGGFGPPGGGAGGPGGFGGRQDSSVTAALSYVRSHGGGTLGIASQSSAASSIISSDAQVAGVGGFSGRESSVSVSWLAHEIAVGKIRWVLGEGSGNGGGFARVAGDTRTGSRTAMTAVAQVCKAVSLGSSAASGSASGRASSATTLYDCSGRASALLHAGSVA
jgi:4-amino-4-deoxy-L-arabinose transferase-like glycosyltransferase